MKNYKIAVLMIGLPLFFVASSEKKREEIRDRIANFQADVSYVEKEVDELEKQQKIALKDEMARRNREKEIEKFRNDAFESTLEIEKQKAKRRNNGYESLNEDEVFDETNAVCYCQCLTNCCQNILNYFNADSQNSDH